MTLPTNTDLLTLNYSYQGQPFVHIPAKSGMNLSSMDYSFQASPFMGNSESPSFVKTIGGVVVGSAKTIQGLALGSIKLIGGIQ